MLHKINPVYLINDFFESYADALERKDTSFMANCYALPCTFLADDSSLVYTTAVKLEGLINQSKRFYAIHGITSAIADIKNKRAVTDKIVRVTLNWSYLDNKNRTVYNCDYYYILKLNDEGNWKIEVAVPINEKQRVEELTNKAAK